LSASWARIDSNESCCDGEFAFQFWSEMAWWVQSRHHLGESSRKAPAIGIHVPHVCIWLLKTSFWRAQRIYLKLLHTMCLFCSLFFFF
jgi:hypothetical protein